MKIVCFQALDVVLRFEVLSPELLSGCSFCQLPNWKTLPGPTAGMLIRLWREEDWLCYQIQDGLTVRLRRPLPFWRRLRSDCHLALAQVCQDYIFVHAGVVRFDDGGLLLLPGRSRAGKSTLTHRLTQQGYAYYSDEYALVRADGRVASFPRALSLRHGPSQRVFVSAQKLGWRGSLEPERVRLLLKTSYQNGANWEPEPMRSSEALTELIQNSVTASTQPSKTIANLRAMIQGAQSWRGLRGDSGQIVSWLQRQVASSTEFSSCSARPEA